MNCPICLARVLTNGGGSNKKEQYIYTYGYCMICDVRITIRRRKYELTGKFLSDVLS